MEETGWLFVGRCLSDSCCCLLFLLVLEKDTGLVLEVLDMTVAGTMALFVVETGTIALFVVKGTMALLGGMLPLVLQELNNER
jgi:hypothetical protein